MMRKFCNAWQRENHIEIDRAFKDSMAPYIEGPLADKIGLEKDKGEKKFLTIENYVHMQTFLWEQDFHDYVHEGVRTDYTNLFNIHCFTSARLSELCQAYYNPMFHLLANIISSGAYPELSTVEQSLAIRPPENTQFRIIASTDAAKQKPVFPQWNSSGRKDEHRNPTSWANQFYSWGVRTGLAEGVSVHCIRREALIKANDNGYSIGQVLKFASQRNTSVLVHHYLSNITTIDGTGSFLGMNCRVDLAEHFRSATMKYNPDLIQSIPASEKTKLENSEEYVSISEQIQNIKVQISKLASGEDYTHLRLQIKAEQMKLRDLREKRLRQLQMSQPITYESIKSPHELNDKQRSQYHRIKHMLPKERIRLAGMMTKSLVPRSEEWVSALQDLVTLRTTNSGVAFQEPLRPVDGHCVCGKLMKNLPLKNQWPHSYMCHKENYKRKYGFAKFCFLCSEWVISEREWEGHCLTHIEKRDIPFRCDPVTFRYGTACAGYCPVHLQNESLPARLRLKQYRLKQNWEDHIALCLASYIANSNSFLCPHMLCEFACNSRDDFEHHLDESHGIELKLVTKKSQNPRKRKLNSEKEIFITKSAMDFSRQSATPIKNADDFDNLEYTSTLMCEEFVANTNSLSKVYKGSMDIEEDIDMADSIDPALYQETTDSTTVVQISELNSDSNIGNASSSDVIYEVRRIIARWKSRREILYLVEWGTGGTSWQPADDIFDQEMIDDFERIYEGFQEGISVLDTRTKNGKVEYYIEFLDYIGSKKDAKWWVPESTMHPDLRIKGSNVEKKRAKRRKMFHY
ncbi:hypothetical protein THAR02_11181 [Trichoderma harzianum]|uniref:Chromo domain-containing protein n=1 Tax=Trichoderma harzianum TaxID=5544 RepID=A0A0F9WU67_TRIHA|nr:hypothetical protein THAR02_11181 [Trichoderma harzianum]